MHIWEDGWGSVKNIQKICARAYLQYSGFGLFQIRSGWGGYCAQIWRFGVGSSMVCP